MPPCSVIQDKINAINAEIQILTDEIDSGFDVPPKAMLVLARRLIALYRELAILEEELKACQNPQGVIEENIQADKSKIVSLTAQIQVHTQQLAGLKAQLTSVESDLLQQQEALTKYQAAH